MRIPAGYGKNTNAVTSVILAVTHDKHLNGVQGVAGSNPAAPTSVKPAEFKGVRTREESPPDPLFFPFQSPNSTVFNRSLSQKPGYGRDTHSGRIDAGIRERINRCRYLVFEHIKLLDHDGLNN